MIVYGQRSKLIKSELIHEPCPNCGKNFSVQMNVFQRYAHIFWIPFFPTGKTGVSQCSSCGQVVKYAHMSDALKAGYENVKRSAGTPVWMFSGLGLVAIIAAAVSINDSRKSSATSGYVLNPKAGDIVQIKLDSVYTLLKLTSVDKDSIHFVTNQYQTTDDSQIDDLSEKPYDTLVLAMAKTKLVDLNKKGDIINIDR
jgi:hypothetical protein